MTVDHCQAITTGAWHTEGKRSKGTHVVGCRCGGDAGLPGEVVGHTAQAVAEAALAWSGEAREGLLLETSFTPRLQKGAESPRVK